MAESVGVADLKSTAPGHVGRSAANKELITDDRVPAEKGACAQIGTHAASWCDLGHNSRRTCERAYRFFFFFLPFSFLFLFLCSSVPFLVSFCSFYFLSTDRCDRSGPGVEPVTRLHPQGNIPRGINCMRAMACPP